MEARVMIGEIVCRRACEEPAPPPVPSEFYGLSSETASLPRPAHAKHGAARGVELDDDSSGEAAVGNTVAEHHPALLRRPFPRRGERHVDGLVAAIARIGAEGSHGARSRVVAENAVAAARGVFGAGERGEEDRAEHNPPGVEQRSGPFHGGIIAAA